MIAHIATLIDKGTFVGTHEASWLADSITPFGMVFVVGEMADGTEQIQAIKASATDWTPDAFRGWLAEHGIEPVSIAESVNEPTEAFDEAHGAISGMDGILWRESKDHTYRIEGVPIFRLGETRGFTYDEGWFERAKRNFEADKAQGALPPIIVGHNEEGQPERPAKGHIDNLRRMAEIVIADFVKVQRDLFRELRRGNWPQRSVEVWPEGAKFSALALLGGSMPQFKFAPVAHFKGQSVARFAFQPAAERGDDKERIMPNDSPKAGPGTPAPKDGGQDKDLAVRFAESEAEKERLKAVHAADQKRLAALEEEGRQTRIARFKEGLRSKGFSAAVIDSAVLGAYVERASNDTEVIVFSEKDKPAGLPALGALVDLFAELAAKGTLFVKTGEMAGASATGEHPDDAAGKQEPPQTEAEVRKYGYQSPEDVHTIRFLEKYAVDNKVTFSEAAARQRRGEIEIPE